MLALLAMLERADTGDLDAADATARQALTVAEEAGDVFATAHALTDLWLSHGVRCDHAAALDYVDRTLRVLGDDADYADLRSYALEVQIRERPRQHRPRGAAPGHLRLAPAAATTYVS